MSAICASLTYPSDEEDLLDTSQDLSFMDYDDDSDVETIMSEEDNSTFTALVTAVKQFRTVSGETIHEPFLKLPSKRYIFIQRIV